MSEKSLREQGMNKYKYFFYKMIILPSFFFGAYFVLLSTTTINFWLYFSVLSSIGLVTVLVSEAMEVKYRGELRISNERFLRGFLNIIIRALAMSISLTLYLTFVLDPESPAISYQPAYICISKTYIAISIGFYLMTTILVNVLTLRIFRKIL